MDEPLGVFNGDAFWTIEERGPFRATLCQTSRVSDSTLVWRVRLYSNTPRIEFDLKLHCREKQKRFTLRLPLHDKVVRHTDGIPGAKLERAPSVLEYPFQDWTLVETGDPESGVSVMSPDTFSFSVRENNMHFTLLRAKPYAWVGTGSERDSRIGDADFTDQGEFRYHFVLMPRRPTDDLVREARVLQQPPVAWDLTKGMKRHTKYLLRAPEDGEAFD
jgi:alpha-mannosidase